MANISSYGFAADAHDTLAQLVKTGRVQILGQNGPGVDPAVNHHVLDNMTLSLLTMSCCDAADCRSETAAGRV